MREGVIDKNVSICWGIWRGEERVRREEWEKKKEEKEKREGGKETCMLGE